MSVSWPECSLCGHVFTGFMGNHFRISGRQAPISQCHRGTPTSSVVRSPCRVVSASDAMASSAACSLGMPVFDFVQALGIASKAIFRRFYSSRHRSSLIVGDAALFPAIEEVIDIDKPVMPKVAAPPCWLSSGFDREFPWCSGCAIADFDLWMGSGTGLSSQSACMA